MHRTNIVLDSKVLDQAKNLTGITTAKEVIHHALTELIRHKRQKRLLQLQGKVNWTGD